MATRKELRNRLIQLATDSSIDDEDLLDGCAEIAGEYTELKKDEKEAKENEAFMQKAKELQIKMYEIAWSMFMDSAESRIDGDPADFIWEAYAHAGLETWVPLQFGLPLFGEDVPCTAEECWYGGNLDRINEYDGTLYVNMFDDRRHPDYAVCRVCYDNDYQHNEGVFNDVKCVLLDGYCNWLRTQEFSGLDEEQRKSLAKWLEINLNTDDLEQYVTRLGLNLNVQGGYH